MVVIAILRMNNEVLAYRKRGDLGLPIQCVRTYMDYMYRMYVYVYMYAAVLCCPTAVSQQPFSALLELVVVLFYLVSFRLALMPFILFYSQSIR